MKLSKYPIILILIAIFLKQLLWVGIVPLWHFPDEQAHFAQIQNIAEKGFAYAPTSNEIALSEKLLKTYRTDQGRNSFTMQPWFNLPYTNNTEGQYEQQIKALPEATRTLNDLKLSEATSYPLLYYTLAATVYQLFHSSDLFTRVFVVRIFSAVIFTITIGIVWLIGKLIHQNFKNLPSVFPLTLTIIAAFHPMFSFVGASPNSDVLFNLLFTLCIYGCLTVLTESNNSKQKLQPKNLSNHHQLLRFAQDHGVMGATITICSIVLGLLTKQQMVVALALIPFVALYRLKSIISYFKIHKLLTITSVIIAVVTVYGAVHLGEVARIRGFLGDDLSAHPVSLLEHLKWSLETTYRQTLPWYWGVYRWLSLTLPRWVNRVQMLILLVSGLGIMMYLVKPLLKRKSLLNRRKFTTNLDNFLQQEKIFLFLIYTSAIYYGFVIGWDWLHRMGKGFPFGVQGRYFFPTIVAHMALILIGLSTLITVILNSRLIQRSRVILSAMPAGRQVAKDLPKILPRIITGFSIIPNLIFLILSLWFIILNTIAIWVVSASYYDHSSFQQFIVQASQYKPAVYKGDWWYVWITLYSISCLTVTAQVIKCSRKY